MIVLEKRKKRKVDETREGRRKVLSQKDRADESGDKFS